MPIYDYQCLAYGGHHCFEQIEPAWDNGPKRCPQCGLVRSKRIIGASGQYVGNQDADWLKSVRKVVGKETREGREFHLHPTRANYQAWMKSKGLRPLERNEPIKPPPTDLTTLHKKVFERHRKRMAITIR